MKKPKVIYIISFIDKALIYEWTIDWFEKSEKLDVSYILMNPVPLAISNYIEQKKIRHWDIKYSGKKDLAAAIFKIYKILRREKPQIINTNLFDASMAGQIAGLLARIPVRIHSRHYSSLHLVYHKQAVKYDRLLNKIATNILVATKMVKELMISREKVNERKIKVINYGFKLNDFINVSDERVNACKQKYLPVHKKSFPVIGVISRFIHWKGIQFIIPAFSKIKELYPDAHLVLANAKGNYSGELNLLLSQLPENCFTKIEYEKDSPALYKIFDVFIHTPVDYHSEAFGQIYVEALVAGIPSVLTASGIALEFIGHEENALVVDYNNSEQIFVSLKRLLEDDLLRNKIISNGRDSVMNHFEFDRMGRELDSYYLSLLKPQY